MQKTKLWISGSILALMMLPMTATASKAAQAAQKPMLTEKTARQRAQRVSDVKYRLQFSIDAESPDFTGQVEISFRYRNGSSAALPIDFAGGKIHTLEINGKPVPRPSYDGLSLRLPARSLVSGQNSVKIAFSHPYNKSGSGLYRFKDPEDGAVYLYTDFEPFDANLLFPCFDQPDLKATYTLSVEAPDTWTVISNSRESETRAAATAQRKTWVFPETKPFSTYLFALHAGPYASWESQWKSGGRAIPLRLFARRSLAPFVESDDWLKVTRQGFDFFESYFDYPYPFDKYDQIIVPDFNAGAMENVGAVTFSESYVRRGKSTLQERERRSNTLLHEMAHMWFGNLTTMRWWDDLWLNESFATYMAYLALSEATEFKSAWQSFFARTKQWAYWEDQLSTTHAISTPVPNTDVAFSNFDGITYGKGASSLKQLAYFLGSEPFRNGVRAYFKKHAFSNTVLNDFMDALAQASGTNLDAWTRDWLKRSGLNSIEARTACVDGKISRFELHQRTVSGTKTVRSHKTQVGLFKLTDGKLEKLRAEPVVISGAITVVPSWVGAPCPDLVYPNLDDHGFAKVVLDAKSVESAKAALNAIDDDFLRMMLWENLWDMTYDGLLPIYEYAELVFKNAPKESNIVTLTNALNRLSGRGGSSPSVLFYAPDSTQAEKAALAELKAKIEAFYWQNLGLADAGGDAQKLWFDSYVRVAESKEGQSNLLRILSGDLKLKGLDIDQDRRWSIVYRLSLLLSPEAGSLLAAERERDPSDRGKKSALAAEVVPPVAANKRKWFDAVFDEKSTRTLNELKTIIWNLFPASQRPLHESLAAEFYTRFPSLVAKKEAEFVGEVAEGLVPAVCTPKSANRLSHFLDAQGSLNSIARTALRKALDDERRCVRVRATASRSLKKRAPI